MTIPPQKKEIVGKTSQNSGKSLFYIWGLPMFTVIKIKLQSYAYTYGYL